jgi:hypothetical protein
MSDDVMFEIDDGNPRRKTTVMEFLTTHKAVAEKLVYGEWTTEPPTVAGWYWARTNKGIPYIVRVGLFGTGVTGTLWVYTTNSTKAFDFDMVDYWLGPLPVPEPPKE